MTASVEYGSLLSFLAANISALPFLLGCMVALFLGSYKRSGKRLWFNLACVTSVTVLLTLLLPSFLLLDWGLPFKHVVASRVSGLLMTTYFFIEIWRLAAKGKGIRLKWFLVTDLTAVSILLLGNLYL